MTEVLLDKLYSLGLIRDKQSLEDGSASHFGVLFKRQFPRPCVLCEKKPQFFNDDKKHISGGLLNGVVAVNLL